MNINHIILRSFIIWLVFFGFFQITTSFPSRVEAVECQADGECVDNRICRAVQAGNATIFYRSSEPCGSYQVGGVTPPGSINRLNLEAAVRDPDGGSRTGIGIVIFLSNLVHLFAIVAGIFAMFNFVFAGFIFLSSGADPGAMEKVREKITWTLIGIAVIVFAYSFVGLIGLLFFGNAGFILNPNLYSVLP